MRYMALASDYDGTLANKGVVDEPTLAALEALRASGRKLILVSGRELVDLQRVFPHLERFDIAVLENGALLYEPATRKQSALGEAPAPKLVEALRERGVTPLGVGRVIIATRVGQERAVLEVVRDLGIERQLIFNKGAVMVLPPGVNKATGLAAALSVLGLSQRNVVAVGDAENDHALLSAAECGVAVANAIAMLQERADVVTRSGHGEGVREVIEGLLADDLQSWDSKLERHYVEIGTAADGAPVRLSPYGQNLLFAGPSEGGKTTLALAVLERIEERGYQVCIIDPEGDQEESEDAIVIGDAKLPPQVDALMQLLDQGRQNVVANLVGIPLADRPTWFSDLLVRVQHLRARTGRPHWLMVDEAHHVMPAPHGGAQVTLPVSTTNVILVTTRPQSVAPAALRQIDVLFALGARPSATIEGLVRATGERAPSAPDQDLARGDALMWSRREQGAAVLVHGCTPRRERKRHRRKYAQGDLGDVGAFYFRGPAGRLRLRAQNLTMFVQLADGVDDETWLYHLRRQDYSRWMREHIEDDELAEETAAIENDEGATPELSRARVRHAIERRYSGAV